MRYCPFNPVTSLLLLGPFFNIHIMGIGLCICLVKIYNDLLVSLLFFLKKVSFIYTSHFIIVLKYKTWISVQVITLLSHIIKTNKIKWFYFCNHKRHPENSIDLVRDLLDLVHNVILIECIFGSGKPGGSGFWAKGSTWATVRTKGGQFTSNREQRWTDPDTARRVPSK